MIAVISYSCAADVECRRDQLVLAAVAIFPIRPVTWATVMTSAMVALVENIADVANGGEVVEGGGEPRDAHGIRVGMDSPMTWAPEASLWLFILSKEVESRLPPAAWETIRDDGPIFFERRGKHPVDKLRGVVAPVNREQ